MPEYAKFHGCRNVIEKYHRLFISCLRNVLKPVLMVVAHGLSQQHSVASLFGRCVPAEPGHHFRCGTRVSKPFQLWLSGAAY